MDSGDMSLQSLQSRIISPMYLNVSNAPNELMTCLPMLPNVEPVFSMFNPMPLVPLVIG